MYWPNTMHVSFNRTKVAAESYDLMAMEFNMKTCLVELVIGNPANLDIFILLL